MKKSDFEFKCDRCTDGKMERYGHIDNGICYKCSGVGRLMYNPQPFGVEEKLNQWSEQEYWEIQAEQEKELNAQKDYFEYVVNDGGYAW